MAKKSKYSARAGASLWANDGQRTARPAPTRAFLAQLHVDAIGLSLIGMLAMKQKGTELWGLVLEPQIT
jgi:hypothetical protein